MLRKFRDLCREKNWETNCFNNLMCADGEAIEACYTKSSKNNYRLIAPLTEMRTSLEIPFQSTLYNEYMWRAFLSRTYIAGNDWWSFSNEEWSIYCVNSLNIGDLGIKFGFGSLIADEAIRSVILRFLKSIDTDGISSILDTTQVTSSDIVLGVHDSKDYGGVKGVFELMQKQLASMFKSANIKIHISDWIYHPGSARFTITIPFEFQDAT